MAITQLGTTVKIGFDNQIYTGYLMQDVEIEPTGEQDEIKDEENAAETILVSNLGNRITFNAIILGTGSLTPPAIGGSVTIKNIVYRCESSSVKYTSKATMLAFTGIKEASMTYT